MTASELAAAFGRIAGTLSVGWNAEAYAKALADLRAIADDMANSNWAPTAKKGEAALAALEERDAD